ncbi:MAG: prephenate/arogenate dehydrogenase family protein [Hyphomonas sp.]|uniref:prephenate/arogenate dehydrogenase family protein n=1 Tax=Hyphomonas sp. TaxID=87 RepID=UPI00184341BB|nr:prephenate/arogenate dehydrogenase family protein [Hyphomonas sp.]MBA3070284.1 prephenate/arogenate dehydrogenase family protein [Hyphomonas sp.]MBU4062769.1 prephenate/arogenate dehydrogenase family protein [Alphaproteobacteria bacterium]MBU4163688.1 prephenate/arogenate dehydrogenase family protein [Alphaproteobacteria bacterium]
MTEPVFSRIAIVGVGLIGSSIDRAAREYGAAGEIVLYDASPDVRARAEALQLGEMAPSLEAAVAGADCVVLCVPVGALGAAAAGAVPAMKDGAILTDVGSVKGEAARALAAAADGRIHVIPGHPIAGTEQSGPEAGFATLFQGAWHILTPVEGAVPGAAEALEQLTAFWRALGAKVETMDAARHDRVLAITSHLPHLIAFNIVATAFDMETVEQGEVVKYSAGGFRDFTRIAASDPVMWRDVFLNNRDAVLECLGRFSEDLAALQRAIRWGDGDMLMREFTRARTIRKAIIDAGQDSGAVNFGRNVPSAEE